MHLNLVRVTSEIVSLAKSGRIVPARKLFDETPQKDSVCWNAMLSSYSQMGFYQEALSLFHCMRIWSTSKPDNFTYTAALSASSRANDVRNGTMIHGLAIVSGFGSSLPVNNALVDLYGKCSSAYAAQRVFNEISSKNHVSWCSLLFAYVNCGELSFASNVFTGMAERSEIAWNIMISGHARCGDLKSCLGLFKDMQKSYCQPDQWTYSAAMNVCAESGDPFYGQSIHGVVIKNGWTSSVEANNSIISFYAKLGYGCDVIWLFESSGALSQVSWNAIIDAYMKMGDVHKACLLFEQSPEKNVVSWTSMISGYARNGHGEEALNTFVGMMRNCVQPDHFSFGAALHSCSILAIVGYGRIIHGSLIHYGYNLHTYAGNGLINMYAKCGDIDGSSRAFHDITHKDLVSWNAMLFGFGLHGRGSQAVQLYEKMLASSITPDKVTFIGLLITCSHLGFIQKGREFFESMSSDYGISQEIDHVACMVDMLSRGGFLEEAKELSRAFSGTHSIGSSTGEAMLGACFAQQDVQIGTKLAETWNISDPRKDVNYVMLSNFYCVNGLWTEAEAVRKAMAEKGVKKMPGFSLINIGNKAIAFTAGYNSLTCMDQLCKVLYFLELEMKTPCTNLSFS